MSRRNDSVADTAESGLHVVWWMSESNLDSWQDLDMRSAHPSRARTVGADFAVAVRSVQGHPGIRTEVVVAATNIASLPVLSTRNGRLTTR